MFCRNWLKLRITVQPVMQKARVVEPKTQCRFVVSHESSVGELVWWAWLQPFVRCIDLLQIFGPTFLASSWAGEVFLSIPSTSSSRPTLGLEVYEFYLNLLSFSVFLPSLIFYYNHCFQP